MIPDPLHPREVVTYTTPPAPPPAPLTAAIGITRDHVEGFLAALLFMEIFIIVRVALRMRRQRRTPKQIVTCTFHARVR